MTLERPGIVPIVEGPGDKEAAPVLLRRVLYERSGRFDVAVLRAKSANGKSNLIARLEDFLAYARTTAGCAAILVLLDADEDCPKELGHKLARRVEAVDLGVPAAVVCANRKYENWFLTSDPSFHGDVETYGDAKGWLTRGMPRGLAYKETSDQPKLSASMNLETAFDASRSFRRLCDALSELANGIEHGTSDVTPA